MFHASRECAACHPLRYHTRNLLIRAKIYKVGYVRPAIPCVITLRRLQNMFHAGRECAACHPLRYHTLKYHKWLQVNTVQSA